MRRALLAISLLVATVILSGCFGAPTDHRTVVSTVCTRTISTVPAGGGIGDIVYTFIRLRDERLTIDVTAPDWADVGSTFPFAFTVSGFGAPRTPAGSEVDATLLANDGLWTDPNAPADTDLAADPNTAPFTVGLFEQRLRARRRRRLTFGSSVGGPSPVYFRPTSLTLYPVEVDFDGISAFGPLVTHPDGSKSLAYVECLPTHPGQFDPALITITPHRAS